MTAFCIGPPAAEPLTLDDAKLWLRLDSSAEDDLVASLIGAARIAVEAHTRRLLITQTWRVVFDAWPNDAAIMLPLAPVQSVTALRVLDATGTWQTVSSSLYRVAIVPDVCRVRLIGPVPSPSTALGGIAVDALVGYGAADDVPEPLRQAMRQLVAWLYENRGDAAAGLPPGVRALLAPFCRPRLA